MVRLTLCLFAITVLARTGLPTVQGGILFDNGPAAAVDNTGLQNSDAYTVYDNFTLSSESIITEVTWREHDSPSGFAQVVNYASTDLTFFKAIPSAASEISSGSFVASRTANGSPPVFSRIGFDYRVTGLALDLSAGTYFIGIHSNFSGGETSSWDLATGSSLPLLGRYQSSSPPDAGSLLPNEDSVFQIFGTPVSVSATDPPLDPVPEPSSLVMAAILLALFGAAPIVRQRCWIARTP